MRTLILASLAILVATLGYARPQKPRLGEALLLVSPRTTVASIGQGARIRVRVEIPKPTPAFFCPSVELTVYGTPACDAELAARGRGACDETTEDIATYHEKAEADCDPWREEGETVVQPESEGGGHYIPPTRDTAFVWPYDEARRVSVGSGEWTFQVELVQGARHVTLREHVTVH